MKQIFILFALPIVLSCTTSTGKHSKSIESAVSSAASTDNSQRTQISLTLTGGDNAGTYKAGSVESGCSMGLTGEKSFGLQYSETGKGAKELSSAQMIVDDYEAAKKGTEQFNVMFTFGNLLSGNSYIINAEHNKGSGKLTITESGGAKIATIEGKTKEGVGIKAVITCKTVMKMVDGQLKEE